MFQEATIPESWKMRAYSGLFTITPSSKVKFLCGDQMATWTNLVATYLTATSILSTPEVDAKFLEGVSKQMLKLMRQVSLRMIHT